MHGRRSRTTNKLLVLLSVAAILASLGVTSTVLAVNATGAFELEGNAVTEAGVAGNDDADRVCYQDAITDGLSATAAAERCGTNTGTTGATAASWIDAQSELTIFTGGGSKDPEDPGVSWLWKPKDTVPDKDTLEHSWAARYSLPKSTNCPAPAADPTCEVIYFGVDRFDNSGDAQLGFWFFKNEIRRTNVASQGGFKFSGNHANGDLLLISQFSNGGTTATIEAHFWDSSCAKAANNSPIAGQCSAKNLRLQARSTAANCLTSSPTAPFCGIVNPTNGTAAPWDYTDKSGNHTYLQGEYYEAGVNLSNLGIGNACFPSFLAESRSSTSPTATLKDFTLGNFQNCSATAQTTPSSSDANGANGTVTPGTPVTDTILITGAGTANPPFPGDGTGDHNVVFSMCGPIATGICDDSDSAHTDAPFGASKPLTPTATQGVSTATSDPVNTAANPLTPGRYCFVGDWDGDSNYPQGASDNSTRECFNVAKLTPTLATTSSPTGGNVVPGTSVSDTVTLTGPAGQPTPQGSVDFFLCQPSEVTAAGCPSGSGTKIGATKTLNAGGQATSDATMNTNAIGTYCWRAEYGGSLIYNAGSHTNATSECFTTIKLPSDTTTTSNPNTDTVVPGTSVTDSATVSGGAGNPVPTGSIEFYLCQPSEVTAAGCPTGAGTKVGATKTLNASGQATSDATTNTTAIGKYCWRAEYGGSALYNASTHTNATTECFTTVKQPSQTSTTSNPTGDTTPGISVTDSATVTGGTGQPTPGGSIEFYLCQPADVTAAGCPTGSGTKVGTTKTLDANGQATSDATTNTNALGKYCWRAEYGGDGFYSPSSHTNATTECFTVKTTSSQTSAQNWLPNDAVTVSSSGGYALDGTLVITLREDSCTGTVLYTEDGDAAAGIQPITLSNTPSGTVFNTSNTTVKVTSASDKTYYWRAVFTSSNEFIASSTKCELTTMTINNNP